MIPSLERTAIREVTSSVRQIASANKIGHKRFCHSLVKEKAACLHDHYAELAGEKEKRNSVPVKILRGE